MEVPVSITRQADYAVRAVIHLARLGPGGRAATGQIARAESIPPTFLAKIVSQLSASGIVRATRGARGGVMLAHPADELNMLEIIEAIDGPVMLNECVSNPEICPQSDDCVVRTVWGEAQADLVARLKRTTIAQLQAQNGTVPV
jgi:Rrf2 family protein